MAVAERLKGTSVMNTDEVRFSWEDWWILFLEREGGAGSARNGRELEKYGRGGIEAWNNLIYL